MKSGSRGAWMVVLGSVVTAAACGLWPTFPDSSLHGPLDAGSGDGSVTDVPVVDAADVPEMDAPTDVSDADDAGDVATDDVTDGGKGDADVVVPTDADLCGMVPSAAVPSRRVGDGVMGAHDITIDALGRMALGVTNQVTLLNLAADGGSTSTLVTGLAGEVRSLRYTGNGLLTLAVERIVDGGDPDGVIAVAPSLGGASEVRVTRVTRPGGVAVDRDNGVWFSNTSLGRVYRFVPTPIGAPDAGTPDAATPDVGTPDAGTLDATTDGGDGGGSDAGSSSTPVSMVTDITVPTYLAFTADGTGLYITNTVGTLFRVTITRALGLLTVSASAAIAGGLGNISGLAVDECGNAYVSDISRNVIRRVSPDGMTITNLATDVMMPRGLAFGQGMGFDRTTLYTLSEVDGSVHAIDTVAPGVLLPSP